MMENKCRDCPYFKVLYEPIKSGKDVWDLGKAKCTKYDLVTDFISHRKFGKLNCILEKSL